MGLERFSYLIKLPLKRHATKEKIGRGDARPGKSLVFVKKPCAEH